ncbi:uncharacterized protein LOC135218052 [Macrobrachium nipponense]|uniref:uncharacterized protein LOC135218052 n=1 Tax=Macrobrachium nipponense TaxID=159736 RepID=UPI0030C8252F
MKTYVLSLLFVAMAYHFYTEALPAPEPAAEPMLLSSLADPSRAKRQAPGKFAINLDRCCECPAQGLNSAHGKATTIIITTIIINEARQTCCPCTDVGIIQPSRVES